MRKNLEMMTMPESKTFEGWYSKVPYPHKSIRGGDTSGGKLLMRLTAKYCTKKLCFGSTEPDDSELALYQTTLENIKTESSKDSVDSEISFASMSNILLLMNSKDNGHHGFSYISSDVKHAFDTGLGKKDHHEVKLYRSYKTYRFVIWIVIILLLSILTYFIYASNIQHTEAVIQLDEVSSNVKGDNVFQWFWYTVIRRPRPVNQEKVIAENNVVNAQQTMQKYIIYLAISVLLVGIGMIRVRSSRKTYYEIEYLENSLDYVRNALKKAGIS